MQKLIKNIGDYAPLVEYLAERLDIGDALLLEGDLGVGKTCFATLLIRRLRHDDSLQVPSPTFALSHIYAGTPPIYHYDLYRLQSRDELWELGLEEAYGRGIILVEWPEILAHEGAENFAPQKGYRLRLCELPNGTREANLISI